MKVSFAEFVKRYLGLPYKIPEYMKSFIKDMEGNKRYCICLHRHAGRRTINEDMKNISIQRGELKSLRQNQ